MYHSITFGDKNTYDDWKLVPCERPVFVSPTQKTTFLDIPGADGSLDVSDSLTGYPIFNDREGSFDFYVLNDYVGYHWMDIYSDIMENLHGKRLQAVLEDDPGYYYDGRFWIDKWTPDAHNSKVTIKYRVNPYKWMFLSSADPGWFWDSFNFNDGMIGHVKFKDIEINASDSGHYESITIYKREKGTAPVCPDFIVNSANNLQVVFNSKMYSLTVGHNIIHDIVFYGTSDELLSFHGSGVLSIDFRKGRL